MTLDELRQTPLHPVTSQHTDNQEAGSSQTDLLSDKLELVKHIIQVKKAEQEANEKAEDRRKQKQQLLEILHEKRNDGLKALSIEEIEAKINEL